VVSDDSNWVKLVELLMMDFSVVANFRTVCSAARTFDGADDR
jgi:hypothetical protein